jgi:hypothetical protein
MLHEAAKQLVFLWGELHIFIAHFDGPFLQVENQIANDQDPLLNRRLTSVTQCGSHASVELTYAEWFGHIVISTQIERRHLGAFIRYAR